MPNRGIISDEGNSQALTSVTSSKNPVNGSEKHKSLFSFKRSEIASPISRKMKTLALKFKHHSDKSDDHVIEGCYY